jgi:Kef-type K+ transport system membrane component KefB
MKNIKNILFYIFTIGGFIFLMTLIARWGAPQELLKIKNNIIIPDTNSLDQIKETLRHNFAHPLSILLLQIITIIATARIFGFLFKKIGQPSVIGEIIAGIFLGPSFIGMWFPEFSLFLFPKASLPNLQFLSQIGLVLFMFIVGMELDLNVLKKRAHEAIIISHASIIFPFALGMGLAYFIYLSYAPTDVKFLSFALFLGISVSITAFPVLARIVQERQLTKTRVGAIAITCAAADDITAWCILAAVIAIVKAGSVISSIYTMLMAIAYVLIMLKIVRPFLKRIGDIYSHQDTLSKPVVAIFFVTLLSSAYLSETIGIHALFGAFLAGVIMPQNIHFRNIFIEKVEDIALVLLLPLFFVLTGLRTQIGLLNDAKQWEICGIIILVATAGKFIGSAVAAKFTKQSWRDSLMIGALMNTRGLMELIVLNIGFDLGILTPEVFAMMVIMALLTTFMTGPALDFINYILPEKKADILAGGTVYKKFKILFSFGEVERGKSMVRLANSFVNKNQSNTLVSALHMTASSDLHQYNIREIERDSFNPIKKEADKYNLTIQTLFKPTLDFQKEIIETTNQGEYDLLIIGIGQSIYEGSFLGRLLGITSKFINPEKLFNTITGKEKLLADKDFDDKTNVILRSVKSPVGVFVDKGLKKVDDVILIAFSDNDLLLLPYAQKLIHNNESRVSIIDYNEIIKQNAIFKEGIRSIEQTAPNHIALYGREKITKEFLEKKDVMLLGINAWEEFIRLEPEWFSNVPSVLILKK